MMPITYTLRLQQKHRISLPPSLCSHLSIKEDSILLLDLDPDTNIVTLQTLDNFLRVSPKPIDKAQGEVHNQEPKGGATSHGTDSPVA